MEINNQYDFFQNVQLDADGNLLVSIVNGGGAVSGDTRTIDAYLSGTTIHFDRNDTANAYSVDLSPITAGVVVNLDAGVAGSILMSPNYECGFYNSIPVDTIDGGGV